VTIDKVKSPVRKPDTPAPSKQVKRKSSELASDCTQVPSASRTNQGSLMNKRQKWGGAGRRNGIVDALLCCVSGVVLCYVKCSGVVLCCVVFLCIVYEAFLLSQSGIVNMNDCKLLELHRQQQRQQQLLLLPLQHQ